MPGEVEGVAAREAVSDEIVDLLAKRFPDDSKHALCMRLQYAVPIIRSQERQRVRELLEGMVERQELNSQDCGPVVPTASIEAVLDSLEDGS